MSAGRPGTGEMLREAVRTAREAWSVRTWVWLGAFAAVLAGPAVLGSLQVHALAAGMALALAAVGLNFALGLGGMPSLGQGAFVAIGAFTVALLRLHAGWGSVSSALAGVAAAALAGLAVGIGAVRLRGVFIALATWVVSWMVAFGLAAFPGVFGGSQGLVLPRPVVRVPLSGLSFGLGTNGVYEVGAVALALALVLTARVRRSPAGLGLAAARQGPAVAAALGVPAARYQLGAFAGAAAVGGLAGALAVEVAGLADPTSYGPLLSVKLFVAVLLGGEGTVIGPVLGAIALAGIPEVARMLGSAAGVAPERFEPVITSVLLVAAVVLGRGGLIRLARSGWVRAHGHPADLTPEDAPQEAGPVEPRAPAVLVATGLTRRFGGVLALDDVSVDVRPGEIHALVGPNGSGKTTCLRILAGSEVPETGSIRLGEVDVTGLNPAERVTRGLVRTLQRTAVFPELTAGEHVATGTLPSRVHGGTICSIAATPLARAEEARMRRLTHDILAAAGLPAAAGRPAAAINGAEQRLMMLATALGSLPGVLLLDELSAGMSAREVEHLGGVLVRLRDRGFSMLMVEHNMTLVRTIADRVSVLDAGRIIATGTPEAVVADPAVREAYLGG